jgi:hypothetical protein
MNREELRRALRDAKELKDTLTQMFYFTGPSRDSRHARHLLPLQDEYVKLLEAKIELLGEVSSDRKMELEALVARWTNELRPKYMEAREDIVRWRSRDKAAPEETPRLKTWTGNDRAFGIFVIKQFQQGKIPEARSKNKAAKIMCERYMRPDGSRFNPESVLQNLRNKVAEETP